MLLLPALIVAVLMLVLAPTGSGADGQTVTFSSTSTFPVPPASSYAGSGGGDGWALAMTPTAVYNIFHHSGTMQVACHLQKDASECWSAKTVQDANGNTFSTSGHSGLWLDQGTGKLYAFGVRNSDSTAGVACFDTVAADANQSPFCGFTALGAVRDAITGTASVTNIAMVGSRLYSFSFYSGSAETGTRNTLLCFDTKTLAACAGQPYSLGIGQATDNDGTFPPPGVAAIAGDVLVPMRLSTGQFIACFDGNGSCAGNWPVRLDPPGDVARPGANYPESAGAPFAHLTPTGKIDGFCLPYSSDPCWDMSGKPIATPDGMASAIGTTSGWNGPGVVIGPRVYVPSGNDNSVHCYDYAASNGCGQAFPRHLNSLSLLYTVNSDPQRPTCLWVNADNGTQIQNFDAFTGGACGQGPIRVLTEKIVGSSPQCFPSKFTSLRIDSPARSAYTDGTVVFADASGNPAAGATPIALDANGAVDLSSLQLSTNQALPQFLITLKQGGDDLRPQAITVTVTWLGTFDTSCASGGTTIVNPPSPPDTTPPATTPPATTPNTPPPPPPTPNIAVKASGPSLVRVGDTATFTATITNTSNSNASTGTELNAPVPVGSTLVSVTPSQGLCPTGTAIHCILQTIAPGGSAKVTLVVRATQPGTLTFSPTVTGDYDTNASDNTSAASTQSLQPGATPPAPPAPTTPGTVNAISVGTVLVNGQPVPPDTPFVIKTGDSVQLDGILVFTTINGSTGIFSNVPFTAQRHVSSTGRLLESGTPVTFSVTAPSSATDITDLTLTAPDFTTCNAPRRLSAAPSSKVVRQLWGNAHGSFRTTAKYSSATIRGTIWGVVDRCDGTLTSDVVDPVTVQDLVLNKTIELNPGQSYLAKAPAAPFTPPTQGKNTVASVKKNGLVWQGQRFKTKKAFSTWLSQHNSSWAAWSKTHKALAAALALRRR
jgi:uncharacterized repeat protein (TIGR01451 family)